MSEKIVLTHVNLCKHYGAKERQCLLLMRALQSRAVRQHLVVRRDSYLYAIANESNFITTALRWPWSTHVAKGSDVIHAYDIQAVKWAKRSGVEYVVHQSNIRDVQSALLASAACVLASSRSIVERLFATQLHLPVQRIPPMWDNRKYDENLVHIGNKKQDSVLAASVFQEKMQGKTLFGCCTTLDEHSGVLVLIEAMRYISSRYPYVHLVIVGDGPLQTKIKQNIRSLDCVSLVDNCVDVLPWYAIFDAYVAPALQAGYESELVQAMYQALPIVATKLEATEDFIQHNISGLLTPSYDHLALAKNMVMIAENDSLAFRLGNVASNHARKFDPAHIAEKVFRVYQAITSLR